MPYRICRICHMIIAEYVIWDLQNMLYGNCEIYCMRVAEYVI